MDEIDKKIERQCWKTIFITITLLVIGAVCGHLITAKCYWMKRPYGGYGMQSCRGGGYGMRTCWSKCGKESKCCGEKKVCGKKESWRGCKKEIGACKAGCTCPKCSKKKACLSEMKKAGCSQKGLEAGETSKE